ncbi:MAG: tRNA splicing endonuclease [Crocinitomicaceae bacterium]|jgi:tRNA splicing endonuclease
MPLNITAKRPLMTQLPSDFSPPVGVKVYRQRSVINWYDNNIYHIYALPEVEHTLEDAKMQIDLVKKLFGDEKVKVLLDLRKASPISYNARKYYGTEEGNGNFVRTSVLVNSSFNKVLANFFMGTIKKSLKTKMFLSVEEAVFWLNRKG